MLVEEAADQVVAVADAARLLARGGEQQPRVLDAAGAERMEARPHREARVGRVVGAEHRAGDRGAVLRQPQVDEVGVEPEPDAPGGGDLGAVLVAEAHRRAVAEADPAEAVGRLGQRDVGIVEAAAVVEPGVGVRQPVGSPQRRFTG